MPPRKQPKTLQELSLKAVTNVTTGICARIWVKHGGAKYGGKLVWKLEACRDELEIGKTYLSSIQPFFAELLKDAYYETFIACTLGFDLKYILLELLVCDKLRTLDFSRIDINNCTGFYEDSIFWKNQFLKLKNVVELDIRKVRLTDESFQAIGDVCTNVRKLNITSNLKHASMESLKRILNCQELRELRIDFWNWEDERIVSEYVGMLVVGLPKLEYFHDLLFYWDKIEVISITKPLTSMRKLVGNYINSTDLAEMIRLCPNVTDIKLKLDYLSTSPPSTVEQDMALKVLAESSLQLKTLKLKDVALSKELTRVISCKGTHLTSLVIEVCVGRRLSVNDVYTIGVSCPKLVELRISETNDYNNRLSNGSNNEEQTFNVTTPRMFVGLKVLHLDSSIDWDQRIVPLIQRHALSLTSIVLDGVLQPNTSGDLLSQILNVNALQELESLHIETEWFEFTKPLIKRLLDYCPKLVKLYLRFALDRETFHDLTELQNDLESEHFEIELDFIPDWWSNSDSDDYYF